MQSRIDDLQDPRIAQLLEEHLEDMHRTSPPESVHALDLDKLRQPEITFWSLWVGDDLAGCGAIKRLSEDHAEIKSMRTANSHRGKGYGAAMLEHIINHAQASGLKRLSLETGTPDFFIPAQQLYSKYGFEICGPFGDYSLDPYSVFYTKAL